MVELFETIMQYPLQFLAGLGIGGGTIYTVCAIIKDIIGAITKKSKKAKELLQQKNLANAVITALGGVDGFCDKVANVVIEKITTNSTVAQFKQILEQLLQKDDCPVEIKAYIETVLSQTGSEQLHLLYEQTKATLLSATKQQVQDIIDKGNEVLENEPVVEIEPVTEIAQAVIGTKSTKKKSTKEDSDITYA